MCATKIYRTKQRSYEIEYLLPRTVGITKWVVTAASKQEVRRIFKDDPNLGNATIQKITQVK